MAVKVIKVKDKEPKKGQEAVKCPYCENKLIVTINPQSKHPLIDGLTVRLAIMLILIIALGYLVFRGGF